MLQVWNTESGAEYSLNGPVGQVNALESVCNLLFAGVEVGYFTDSLEFLGVSLFRISFSCLSKNLSDLMYFDM